MAQKTIVPFAGLRTDVHVRWIASLFGDLRVTISFAFAGAAAAWAYLERRTRQRVIKRYAPYIEAEERRLDQQRSSSHLTRDGRSPRQDKSIT